MGKKSEMAQERFEQKKKEKRNKRIVGISVSVCIIAAIVVLVILSQPAVVIPVGFAHDANGDLHIAVDSLQENLNYIDFGGTEELILWKDGDGRIRTAFDTCEECYSNGNVHFTLSGDTLTCNLCGTTKPVSELGLAEWGGCQPVSIISDIRNDSETEVIIPADVLAYTEQMFSYWNASDFSISLDTYGTTR